MTKSRPTAGREFEQMKVNEWIGKKENLAVGEDLFEAFKGRPFVSSGFSTEGALLPVSAGSHWVVKTGGPAGV